MERAKTEGDPLEPHAQTVNLEGKLSDHHACILNHLLLGIKEEGNMR